MTRSVGTDGFHSNSRFRQDGTFGLNVRMMELLKCELSHCHSVFLLVLKTAETEPNPMDHFFLSFLNSCDLFFSLNLDEFSWNGSELL